jgi:hypothetical protein
LGKSKRIQKLTTFQALNEARIEHEDAKEDIPAARIG